MTETAGGFSILQHFGERNFSLSSTQVEERAGERRLFLWQEK
jgi:hypothetical protein